MTALNSFLWNSGTLSINLDILVKPFSGTAMLLNLNCKIIISYFVSALIQFVIKWKTKTIETFQIFNLIT